MIGCLQPASSPGAKGRPARPEGRKAVMPVAIHPSVDNGIAKGSDSFAGGTLVCECTDSPVTVEIASQVAHNHACGCTKCWKPAGALFSVVGVVPTDKVTVTANGDKLKVVDPGALIQRHACTVCG